MPWRSGAVGAWPKRTRCMPDSLERVLARLLADAAFRRAFLADPGAVAAQEGLSAEETAALAAMPVQDLETAAWSFACKRNGKRPGTRSSWWRNLRARRRIPNGW